VSQGLSDITERAAELRRDFDRNFALPPPEGLTSQQNLLALRINGQPFAIRLSEIATLMAGKKIVRVPGSNAALLGIVGSRGTIVPVYDLQSLIGHGSCTAPRWLAITAAAQIGLAFDAFEGQLRAGPEEIVPQQARSGLSAFTREILQTEDVARPIFHLPSILETIKV